MTRFAFYVVGSSLVVLSCGGLAEDAEPDFEISETGCGYKDERSFVPNDKKAIEMGFTAQDILDRLNARVPGVMHWADGSETQLSAQFTSPLQELKAFSSPQESSCASYLEIFDLEVHLATADGRLDEVLRNQRTTGIGSENQLSVLWVREMQFPYEQLQVDLAAFNNESGQPDHSTGHLSLSLGWGIDQATENGIEKGTDPACSFRQLPSTDPAVGCNVYDGVLKYISSVDNINRDDQAPFPESVLFEDVLGWWER